MSLLPSSSSVLEHALAKLFNQLIEAIDSDVLYRARDPMQCDKAMLPWLAWQRSISKVEGWHLAKSEQQKRQLLMDYVRKHQIKGTPASIKQFIRDLGLGEVVIHEGGAHKKHNKTIRYRDGFHTRGANGQWYEYQVEFLTEPVSKDEIIELLKILDNFAPARSVLKGFKQAVGSVKHNGKIMRTSQHTRGTQWLI